jgi:4'-phosphopantetheinyl transferase
VLDTAMADDLKIQVSVGPQAFANHRMPLHELKRPAPGEIHLWYLELGKLALSLRGALGDEQKAAAPLTAGQLRFARRFYLRLILGAYLGVPGLAVRLNRKNRGKPVLDATEHSARLHFSMAKSEDCLLIGFSTSSYLGVDLEPAWRRARNALGVARRYFSPAESSALEAMPPSDQDAAFLRAWACKEAVVKASGQGIANQLCRFSIEMDLARPPVMLNFEGDDPADWSLALVRPASHFLGAVAAHQSTMALQGFRLLPAQKATG